MTQSNSTNDNKWLELCNQIAERSHQISSIIQDKLFIDPSQLHREFVINISTQAAKVHDDPYSTPPSNGILIDASIDSSIGSCNETEASIEEMDAFFDAMDEIDEELANWVPGSNKPVFKKPISLNRSKTGSSKELLKDTSANLSQDIVDSSRVKLLTNEMINKFNEMTLNMQSNQLEQDNQLMGILFQNISDIKQFVETINGVLDPRLGQSPEAGFQMNPLMLELQEEVLKLLNDVIYLVNTADQLGSNNSLIYLNSLHEALALLSSKMQF